MQNKEAYKREIEIQKQNEKILKKADKKVRKAFPSGQITVDDLRKVPNLTMMEKQLLFTRSFSGVAQSKAGRLQHRLIA